MNYIFKNGVKGDNKKKSLEIIKEEKMSHVKAIYDSLKENHWAFDSMDLLLTGGGCLMLAEELKYYFPDAQFTEDPINDNAKGFYNVGKMFYEEDN
ncbi:hypothetical protein SDC9_158462 [bioreactor metagenome]|uniref:Plasmid segregation protein ParM/StbA domain-containing protein n=1 Tax=bioreactor metagenome TaxID=1076179 RepID=A0A645FA29_9ZZZZ